MSADGLRHLPDRDLLLLIQKREPDALEVVYDRYIAPVWKLAMITCGGEAKAEQAVYGTFRKVWKRPQPQTTDPLGVRLLAGVQRGCRRKQQRGRRRRFASSSR